MNMMVRSSGTQHARPFRRFHRSLATAVLAAVAVAASPSGHSSAPTKPTPKPPQRSPITSSRLCAAAVVYHVANSEDWGLRTTIAQTALNAFAAAGTVPDCTTAVSDALTQHFSVRHWQGALDAVDAVRSGDYIPSPAACANANTIVPVTAEWSPVALGGTSQCVIAGLAFVSVRDEQP